MSVLKSIIRRLPGGERLVEAASFRRRARKLEKIGDTEERFTHIFKKNKWKDAESISGAGSSIATTQSIRRALPELFDALGIESILDAPCGDYNWFQHVKRESTVRYTGADIVRPLIDANVQNFGDDTTSFIHADICKDPLPQADLWLCRDCLIHLSYADIQRALDNFKRSQVLYLLTTTHRNVQRNFDIPTGHCRMINLEIAPFGFPKPLRYLEDDDHDGTGKCLALWEQSQLAAVSVDTA